MARYSKIGRRIWNDARFRSLSPSQPCGQTLFIYLLTNPSVGVIPGIYSAGELGLSEALGWSIEGFREAFAEALREGLVKADFNARLIWIPNAIRYNQPESPNVVKSWESAWDELPECPLKREAWEVLREALSERGKEWLDTFLVVCPAPSPEGSAKGMPKASRTALPNQEQEQEQEQKQEENKTPAHPSAEPESVSPSLSTRRLEKARLALLASELYGVYPRKVAKQAALKAITKAITSVAERGSTDKHADFEGSTDRASGWLKCRVAAYSNSPEGKRGQYVPYPATWFNGARYDDDEAEWQRAREQEPKARTPGPVDDGFAELRDRPAPAWVGDAAQ